LATPVQPTDELILDHAAVVFARTSFERARLEDVAAGAGLTRAALLYHFKSKDELYARVVERALAELDALVRGQLAQLPARAERDVRAHVSELVAVFPRFVAVNQDAARIVTREMLSEDGPGRALIIAAGAPLLDDVVHAIERHGGRALRPGISVRAVLMGTIADVLFAAAAQDDVRQALWHRHDHDVAAYALTLLFTRSS
jgi:AcrR family transcriptional regulator